MLNALLSGIQSAVQPTGDEAEDHSGGVVLRREQVQMVLYQGKHHEVQRDGDAG